MFGGYEAHPPDGAVRRADEWKLSCILHPAEGVLVPVHFEGNTYGVPRRYMVASAHLAKPRQVFMRQGGRALVWRYDVARKNGDVTDDRAVNLYWHELPEPVSYASLMREAKWARRPWGGVSPATKLTASNRMVGPFRREQGNGTRGGVQTGVRVWVTAIR